MSSERLYSEIMDEFREATTRPERIAVLRKYDHERFREFLRLAFNPNVEFDVPIPKYRPASDCLRCAQATILHTFVLGGAKVRRATMKSLS